ncbi:MAG: bifunctional histidinol-phosphatase/imidazoleglycerol-phosphate dehydratase HisB [Bacteroidetes bacterium]|nr:bifunctional histidinol-phosphatase/imidazoleglycerol-phosphate dehydratase HisB [Bacteroidota bacterium]
MKRVLFIDRDGTLVEEPNDYQIDSIEKVRFLPGVFTSLARIYKETNVELVMVTNQDGLGTDSFPENTFWPAQHFILDTLKGEQIEFSEICIDKSFPHENAPTRKPGLGMLQKYLTPEYDLKNSWVIGDRLTDMELALNLGSKGIFISKNAQLGIEEVKNETPAINQVISLRSTDWHEIADFLCRQRAPVSVHRQTVETTISVTLGLDGKGAYQHHTGLGFFDHMLDQLAKHSGIDLTVQVSGDLHIDEHHTIEDTAIALGTAFKKALGDKRGIERYGFFILPMDDALAQVAIDFGGRPWLVWNATFSREKVGDFPTEMVYHFFKSFSDAAACNVNILMSGENEHHKIEALFKSFAKAIKMAVKRDPDNLGLPTTKGML